uniref:Uncharacterized protein n=1 Tax=Anguilla anguilla TaxID=7936 RepID=A0A0E9QVM7_ANGAN
MSFKLKSKIAVWQLFHFHELILYLATSAEP